MLWGEKKKLCFNSVHLDFVYSSVVKIQKRLKEKNKESQIQHVSPITLVRMLFTYLIPVEISVSTLSAVM